MYLFSANIASLYSSSDPWLLYLTAGLFDDGPHRKFAYDESDYPSKSGTLSHFRSNKYHIKLLLKTGYNHISSRVIDLNHAKLWCETRPGSQITNATPPSLP